MVTIGLTGDVGAGKSTLCKVWSDLGAIVIDSDSIARDMWRVPKIRAKAKKRWGEDFFNCDDKLLYAKIAEKIFTADEEYKFVEKLLYPSVLREIKRQLKKVPKDGWAVAEIPLLFEGGYETMFDCTVYVAAALAKRTERNIVRNFDKKELKRRQSKFMPRKERIKKADFVLQNTGTEDEWRVKCEKLARKILKRQKDAEKTAKQ